MSYRPATVQGARCRKDWGSTSRPDPDSVPVGGGGARRATHQHTRYRRCGGRRRDRRARLRCRWAVAEPGRAHLNPKRRRCGGRRRDRRAQEGLAAVPVGGGGAWPGFETTRRAKLAARTARGRAAAHGHTEQPGPTAHHAAPGTPAAPQRMFHVKHLPNHRPRYPVWPGKWHT